MFKTATKLMAGILLGVAAACVIAIGGRSADAQAGAAPGQAQRGYGRMFDPATVETITGKVTAVNRVDSPGGRSAGVHLVVKTDGGSVDVRLGPEWYLNNQDLRVEVGDQVRVTGSKVEVQGQPVLIASQVHKGDDVLVLRDEEGVPVWIGWRRGAASTTRPAYGPGSGMGRGMGRGMMGAVPAAGQVRGSSALAPDDPASLLANRGRLKLTTEQVRKLEAIQAEARARANAVLTAEQQQLHRSAD